MQSLCPKDTSGDTHLICFICIQYLSAKQLLCLVIFYAGQNPLQSGIMPRRWRHANIISAQLVVVTQRTPAPVYNAVAVSRDRAGLQTPWPSAAADSAMIDFSFMMVIINIVVDVNWPDISGEIHPVYFYIIYCFL